MIAVFFNLFANATFSLLAGLAVVGFFIWLFRIETGRWKLFLLSLPFVKILFDFFRGIPADSVLLSGIDPFALPPGYQTFFVGAGANLWGPFVNAVFSVRDFSGREFGASIGDYLLIWTHKSVGEWAPLLFVGLVLAVSLFMIAFRTVQAVRFERNRRRDRARSPSLRRIDLGLRSVDVYLSEGFSGSPFTGGVLKPYICFPADSYESLSAHEREAVIAHEVSHVRQFDLLTTLFVQAVGDLFWFIPGYRSLSTRIDRMREIVADQRAVSMGADPTSLASALIKLKELPDRTDGWLLYSAFFREKSLLKERVRRLISPNGEKSPRLGWNYLWVRVVVTFWIGVAVLMSTFGGNHHRMRTSAAKAPVSAYFEVFRAVC